LMTAAHLRDELKPQSDPVTFKFYR
jgi:hypothetical protein